MYLYEDKQIPYFLRITDKVYVDGTGGCLYEADFIKRSIHEKYEKKVFSTGNFEELNKSACMPDSLLLKQIIKTKQTVKEKDVKEEQNNPTWNCLRCLAVIRFANNIYCPYCGHGKKYNYSNNKRFKCASCQKRFNIKTGTIYEGTKVELSKWFKAEQLLIESNGKVTSAYLARQIKVTQKTAWYLKHKLELEKE